MSELDSINYQKKCQQFPFKCFEYKTDSITINKVLYKFKFGQIERNEYHQVRKMLIRDSKEDIDENATLIISYHDSLRNFFSTRKNVISHMSKAHSVRIDSSDTNPQSIKNKYHIFNKEIFEQNRKKWIKTKNKCIKKFEKIDNVNIFYVYGYDNETSKDYKNFSWVKDAGMFQTVFFKIMWNYGVLILKPDGKYFMIGSHFSDKNLKLLLKNSDWSEYENDWNQTLEKYLMNGTGVFKKESTFEHINHCF